MNPQIKQGGILNARFLIALGVIIVLILALGYFFYGLQPAFTQDLEEVEFRIDKGESFRSIGARLSQRSLIRSIAVFKLYALLTGEARRLQPGVHELSPEMSIPQILNEISASGKNEVQVTIPEGSSIKDIDFILTRSGILTEGETLSSLLPGSFENDYPFLSQVNSFEGFFFPDTYRLGVDSTLDKLAERFLDNFELKVWSQFTESRDWYDRLILASLLEREVPELKDRYIVAGILLKRLSVGMPLQADATLSYIKCDGGYLECDELRVLRDDLGLVSPYNTYERVGWTPTPISNPGEETIEASLNPKKSPYWYYLSARETGETIFSQTLEEHNINRAKYL